MINLKVNSDIFSENGRVKKASAMGGLSKLFRKYKKESFNRYLTFIRVKRAVELMELNPEVFVKDITAKVGFNDQFHFSRIFRSYTGICPTDYMEQIEDKNYYSYGDENKCHVSGSDRLNPKIDGHIES
ncbi:helix-turn-helix domain-containing protein [Murimonas intestini]|uniref:Helix-turn-helix protein n=1 Tax=Murimonas intestini TaxID=1337051 RepID=A0AB73T999_9FIRM|nr:helix-turn-helix domain-containing protein [Murimonas intestini]MCR1839317.1 helix-turn-helix transcriptional regulator [Murimonas intestini]MCR1864612.1 helix-turn-helix transcriptional regulator [Murimonas intestini]MCR1882222.1 helix-turn-helix transcriptional regulator [Murimonas intestini]